jgi:S1-C subfamily serine protease/predicted esterase
MTPVLRSYRLWITVVAAVLATHAARADDVNEATEKAMKAASAKVAPTVVKIETAGGAEVIPEGGPKKGPPQPGAGPGIRKGIGPTTGLVVDPDGYVVTSSFNFAHKPTDIFVTVPGAPTRYVAKVVAHDQTRMLTLLKIDARSLPVPEAFPKKDVEIGQWSMALGRTQDPNTDHQPSMSIGIVSAVNRIWGKAIQTDAKTSPVNYGGPLVAIDGRVIGVIVPMSNRAEGETAGVDVYDSGIGFAVPLEDVYAVLPRLKEGKDLRRGLLGITPQGTDVYNAAPVIGSVQPDSAASRAGIQVGDKILEINGKKIPNYSTLQHVMGPLYEGDEIAVKLSRGDKEQEIKGIKLQGTLTAYVHAFLGVLPMRDDPGPGVEVRYVYPKSPAEAAGLKAGDRVMKIGPANSPAMAPVPNRAALLALMQRLAPNTEVKVEVKRKEKEGEKEVEKTVTVTAKLVPAPDTLPEKLPLPSSAGKALEGQPKPKFDPKDPFAPKKGGFSPVSALVTQEKKDDKPKVETGLLKRTNEALGREYWVFVPDNYDPNKSYGLIVWFHAAGQGGKDGEKMAKLFRDVCEDHNFILMGPKSGNADGWVPSETELVMQDVKAVMGQYTIDKTRVVAHGMGNGGQMAFYVGFNARDVIRGVAAVGAVLGTNPKENVANQPLSFFIAAGDKDPIIKDIAESKNLLVEKRFPVVFREMKEAGKEYFDAPTFADFLAWIDSLDRI